MDRCDIWDTIVEHGIATEEELELVTAINGYHDDRCFVWWLVYVVRHWTVWNIREVLWFYSISYWWLNIVRRLKDGGKYCIISCCYWFIFHFVNWIIKSNWRFWIMTYRNHCGNKGIKWSVAIYIKKRLSFKLGNALLNAIC